MNRQQLLGIHEMEGGIRKIEISIERIIIWALIFTNIFSVFYLFAKWLNLV
jgi:hypothetical protein